MLSPQLLGRLVCSLCDPDSPQFEKLDLRGPGKKLGVTQTLEQWLKRRPDYKPYPLDDVLGNIDDVLEAEVEEGREVDYEALIEAMKALYRPELLPGYRKEIQEMVEQADANFAIGQSSNWSSDSPLWSEDMSEWTAAVWVGSVYAIMPSGKYYASWTTNQDWLDLFKDQLFNEAEEEVLKDSPWSLESSDVMPDHLYMVRTVTSEEARAFWPEES